MPLIKLPLTMEQFRQLPRNAAYKYEYIDHQAYLTPRPRNYHALLDLQPLEVPELVDVRPIQVEELMSLDDLFAATFRHIQPFGCLDDATRLKAAQQALERVQTGGDGPWIKQASFVAWDQEQPVGAILITLLPETDPLDFDSYEWRQPPRPDCIERQLGRPHLTWIFVDTAYVGDGVGTALLAASVNELLAMGFRQLLSTFMLGNDSSMLWHWRNGFRLLPYPGSRRLMRQKWAKPRDKGGET
jgi:GNAT superfamily N-acetyltransferase